MRIQIEIIEVFQKIINRKKTKTVIFTGKKSSKYYLENQKKINI